MFREEYVKQTELMLRCIPAVAQLECPWHQGSGTNARTAVEAHQHPQNESEGSSKSCEQAQDLPRAIASHPHGLSTSGR